jgi:hypothetical protein
MLVSPYDSPGCNVGREKNTRDKSTGQRLESWNQVEEKCRNGSGHWTLHCLSGPYLRGRIRDLQVG